MRLAEPARRLAASARRWGLSSIELRARAVRSPQLLCADRRGRRFLLKTSIDPGAIDREAGVLIALSSSGAIDGLPLPELFAWDATQHVLAVRFIDHALPLFERSGGVETARVLGRALGTLHSGTHDRADVFGDFEDTAPGQGLTDSIVWTTPRFFASMSHASVALFGRLQAHAPVLDALASLSRSRADRARCLIHGDFRSNNVLVTRSSRGAIAALVDWELAAWSDPARDVGCHLAELLLIAPGEPSDAALRRGRAFVRAYLGARAVRFPAEEDFAQRTLQWAGVAVVHHIYSKTHYERRFDEDDAAQAERVVELLGSPAAVLRRLELFG